MGEIEHKLCEHENIDEAVVLANKNEDGNDYLGAYIVLNRNTSVDKLRDHLSRSLPMYMIPEKFMQVDSVPVNKNGKVDIEQLRKTGKNIGTESNFHEPENEVEEKLLAIWQKILECERISTTDNFFSLGGNSLKAILMIAAISKEFHKELGVLQIFEYENIKKLSQRLTITDEKLYQSIPKAGAKKGIQGICVPAKDVFTLSNG